MNRYKKPPKTYKEQIELLKERGLIFADETKAERQLSTVSYYRLSAYMFPFKKKVDGKIIDEFKEGTTWKDIYNLYVFDRKLRLLVFDAIEKIEVAVRCQIVYQLSHKYGSHWQDNQSIFKEPVERLLSSGKTQTIDVFSEIQRHISDQLGNNRAELFIQHYTDTYDEPINPPSWMCVEIMYFNHLSRICTYLKQRSDVSGIASFFDLPPKTFNSWLHTINYVRNICAHHARLWNRDFNIVPERLDFSRHRIWISSPSTVKRSKVYYFLCMMNYILQTVNPNTSFTVRLKTLISEYNPPLGAMGFPKDWENEKIWSDFEK